jgi:hypothetical protein
MATRDELLELASGMLTCRANLIDAVRRVLDLADEEPERDDANEDEDEPTSDRAPPYEEQLFDEVASLARIVGVKVMHDDHPPERLRAIRTAIKDWDSPALINNALEQLREHLPAGALYGATRAERVIRLVESVRTLAQWRQSEDSALREWAMSRGIRITADTLHGRIIALRCAVENGTGSKTIAEYNQLEATRRGQALEIAELRGALAWLAVHFEVTSEGRDPKSVVVDCARACTAKVNVAIAATREAALPKLPDVNPVHVADEGGGK